MTQSQWLDKTRQDKQVKVIGCMDHTMDNTFESANRVYDVNGVAPTMNTCGGGGLQPKILEVKKVDVKQLGHLEKGTGAHQSNIVYDENGLSPCICGGMGVKQQPTMIVDAKSLRMVRTEEGKAIRKAYESGEVHHGFNEFRMADPREDGVSNTLTTVQKDNLVLEMKSIKIRQATKDGFIDCKIGGGGGSGLPGQPNTQRKSNRERSDMSNSDNGEYP